MLIETLPAAFEMEEILYELRAHSCSLNAGRWDYIFSTIKTFRERPEFVLPDRNDVKMTVPFMKAYSELLVKTCHRRGAHAMGGMAALIPSRKDPEANERAIEAVAADKKREAGSGFDGTWVAHPDVVQTAMDEFDKVLGERPNQVERQRDDVDVGAAELLDVAVHPGRHHRGRACATTSTSASSTSPRGCAATAPPASTGSWRTRPRPRSRARRCGSGSATGARSRTTARRSRADLVRRLEGEELERIRSEIGDDEWFEREGRPQESRALFEQVALADELAEFLTIPAYEQLD